MCQIGCGPTVVSKKEGGTERQRDRQREAAALIVDAIRNQKLLEFILLADDTNSLYSDSNVRNRIIEHVVLCKQANINKLYGIRKEQNKL